MRRRFIGLPRPSNDTSWPVTLIPGDGIGPASPESCIRSWSAPLYIESYDVHGNIPAAAIDSLRRSKVCLKGERNIKIRTGLLASKRSFTRCARYTAGQASCSMERRQRPLKNLGSSFSICSRMCNDMSGYSILEHSSQDSSRASRL